MEKKAITCRVTIKKSVGNKTIKLSQYKTYGVLTDPRHIVTVEGHKFTAGRKAGFGKSGTWELEKDYSGLAGIVGYTTEYYGAYIDQIEEY